MLSGDIRDEQGCADSKPSNVAAGQEVIRGSALLERKIKSNGKHHTEIQPDDDKICRGKNFVSKVRIHDVRLRRRSIRKSNHDCQSRCMQLVALMQTISTHSHEQRLEQSHLLFCGMC